MFPDLPIKPSLQNMSEDIRKTKKDQVSKRFRVRN